MGAAAERQGFTVLQVVPTLVVGAVERGTVDIAKALTDAGWRSLVASSGGPQVHAVERVGARHVNLPVSSGNPFVMLANGDRLAALIENEGVDLVHARGRAAARAARRAARRTGRPFVTTVHGVRGRAGWLGRRRDAVMTAGDRVIAVSGYVADHLRRVHAMDDVRLRLVPRGIDLDVFDPERVSAERLVQLAARWRLPDDLPVIMLPTRPEHSKGHAVLIEALARLGRKDICCLLMGADRGEPRYRRRLDRQVERHGLDSVVRFIDFCRDMPAAYMLADVVVSPVLEPEAFSRTVAESLAMGRPTIATDHGGARETIVPGECGWLTPPGNVAALAAALGEALDLGSEARERMAARARRRVRENFAGESLCARTLAIYRELLAGGADAGSSRAAQ